ncbi:hypothetical protein OAF65_02310 [Verrucomicrobiales bacterium]|nr:hypothetical protein [Verrucomicrobiales bacterium]
MKSFLPPFIYSWTKLFIFKFFPTLPKRIEIKRLKNSNVFEGDNDIFYEEIITAKNYLEYGCGQSTYAVSRQLNIKNGYSVDTSNEWLQLCENSINDPRFSYIHIDLGNLGGYGKPISYLRRDYFKEYIHANHKVAEIDLVLIDGRFRVASFFSCYLNLNKGAKIIFDDYTDRPFYHIVEEFVGAPEKINSRQALFVIKEISNELRAELNKCIDKFEYVFD